MGMRALSESELKAFLTHLEGGCEWEPLAPVLRVLLLTMQRSGELCAARWSDIDFDGRTWALTAKKGRRWHLVPLSDWAVHELWRLKDLAGGASAYVLPNDEGDGPQDPLRVARELVRWRRDFSDIVSLRTYDLRWTGRVGLGRLGFGRGVAARIFNHPCAPAPDLGQVRVALQTWAQYLRGICEREP
jgi:integrase